MLSCGRTPGYWPLPLSYSIGFTEWQRQQLKLIELKPAEWRARESLVPIGVPQQSLWLGGQDS